MSHSVGSNCSRRKLKHNPRKCVISFDAELTAMISASVVDPAVGCRRLSRPRHTFIWVCQLLPRRGAPAARLRRTHLISSHPISSHPVPSNPIQVFITPTFEQCSRSSVLGDPPACFPPESLLSGGTLAFAETSEPGEDASGILSSGVRFSAVCLSAEVSITPTLEPCSRSGGLGDPPACFPPDSLLSGGTCAFA